MKLKIKDLKENVCDVWLRYDDDEVDVVWRDEDGRESCIATLRNDKTIEIHDGTGFIRKV